MAETQPRDFGYSFVAEMLARVAVDWQNAEIASSSAGRNSVLDDFDAWQAALALPYDAQENTNSGKARSHSDRLKSFTDLGMAQMPEDETITARQIFCTQMQVSGMFRSQCFIQSSSQAEYEERRHRQGLVGFDVLDVTAQHLASRFGDLPRPGDFSREVMSLDELVADTHRVNTEGLECVKLLHETGIIDAGQESSPTVSRLIRMQKAWHMLMLDYISFGAAIRGGKLSAVPFWEPKSITEKPGIYYPLAAHFE